MTFHVRVTISRREHIFDPEVRAITQALHRHGHQECLQSLKMNRVFELEVQADSASHAHAIASLMCEQILCEPALEDFSVEVLAP